MNKTKRLILFSIYLVSVCVLCAIRYYPKFILTSVDFVEISALIMLSFTALLMEHYFVKPSDTLAASISILLLFLPAYNDLRQLGLVFNIFTTYSFLMGLLAFISLYILRPGESNDTFLNRLSFVLKEITTRLGSGKLQFGLGLFITVFFYVDSHSPYFVIYFLFGLSVYVIDPISKLMIVRRRLKGSSNEIGEIFGVQSKNTFLVRLHAVRKSIKLFDFVEFNYSMDKENSRYGGIVLENFLLDKEQWIKVLTNREIRDLVQKVESDSILESDKVYKIDIPESAQFTERFVGVVTDHSEINTIKFVYNNYKVILEEGYLIELVSRGKRILYQVINGFTNKELLQYKNESGFIIGTAIQLGEWDSKNLSFIKYGWVPDINTPVFTISKIDIGKLKLKHISLGNIPNTEFPLLIDWHETLTHHLAILGVTGTGKSVFARHLMKEYIKKGVKLICVDFTKEHTDKLKDLNPINIVSKSTESKLYTAINEISEELDEFANKRNKPLIANRENILRENFRKNIESFLENPSSIGILELPDVSNSTGTLLYTMWFFRTLFELAREHKFKDQPLALFVEEAHTIIPEWNFLGSEDKRAQSTVNAISQIALQGRKYNVGLTIIAQRTANVSKNVLTQCNTIVSFKEYDKTSLDFLENYLPPNILNTMINLKNRQAIAVGKGLVSTVPLIFQVPEIKE